MQSQLKLLGFSLENKQILKFTWKCKGHSIAKASLKKSWVGVEGNLLYLICRLIVKLQ